MPVPFEFHSEIKRQMRPTDTNWKQYTFLHELVSAADELEVVPLHEIIGDFGAK
jgi:hypothetical protein